MNPLELLFSLLRRFINFDPQRIASLEKQGNTWLVEQKEKEGPMKKALLFTERWYIQVLCAILLLVFTKSITNWMMSRSEPDVFEDDEDATDAEKNPHFEKFNLN